jgi:hypothetical protein
MAGVQGLGRLQLANAAMPKRTKTTRKILILAFIAASF